MVDIVGERAVDPDAQAAVTDFLDYTEYLPSDLIRSLRLIKDLDETYTSRADTLHDLTKLYGSLPNVEPSMRPDAAGLRHQILSTLDSGLDARESAYAEASRLFDVADRHQNRLKSIIAKLKAVPKPPSRDPTPQPPTSSKKISKSGREIKPATTRLTLNPPRSGAVASILSRPRGRRVTVPGEVLPPYDPDEAIASTEVSDWGSPPPPSPPRPVLKLKQPKPPKERERSEAAEKQVRSSREGSVFKKPTPPPEDAELGSKWKPWTHLTEYEMYKLRKKMKKNNSWDPSPVMIQRELASQGRGWENYFRAKELAEANGTPFNYIEGPKQQKAERSEASSPVVVATPEVRPKAPARSESKKEKEKDKEKEKEKKTAPVRSQAAIAAQETELAARRLGDMGSVFKNIFSPLQSAFASLNRSTSSPIAPTTATNKKPTEKSSKKRKLDEVGLSVSPSVEPDQRKRQKTAPAKPLTLPLSNDSSETPQPSAGTIKIPPLKLNVPAVEESSAESSEDISVEESSSKDDSVGEESVAPKTEESTPPPPAAARPVSRKSTVPPPDVEGLAAPAAATRASSRIASATPAAVERRTPSLSLRVTPAVEASPKGLPTAASRRTKREVPGTVKQTSQDGGAAVSVSKRQSKPGRQKKVPVVATAATAAAATTPSAEVRVDVDGRAEIVDPNEERYCTCGDVSYGEMICCELDEKCEFGVWFHMDCVELAEMPGRTTKWYCPEDRKKYHKGENTNGLVGRGIRP